MKNALRLLGLSASLFAAPAVAAGAGRPVEDFEGRWVLHSGSVVLDSEGRATRCPDFLRNEGFVGRDSRDRTREAQLISAGPPTGVFMSFERVNIGPRKPRTPRFRRSYTERDSLVTALGRSVDGKPVVDFRYGLTLFRDGSLKAWSSSSPAACFYVRPHSR